MKRSALIPAVLPLFLLAACGGSSTGSAGPQSAGVAAAGPASAQTVTIDSTDSLKFDPTTVLAKVGKLTIANKNIGVIPHDFTFDDASLGHTGSVDGGKTVDLTVTFDKPGTYRFICTIHPGMVGKVVVS